MIFLRGIELPLNEFWVLDQKKRILKKDLDQKRQQKNQLKQEMASFGKSRGKAFGEVQKKYTEIRRKIRKIEKELTEVEEKWSKLIQRFPNKILFESPFPFSESNQILFQTNPLPEKPSKSYLAIGKEKNLFDLSHSQRLSDPLFISFIKDGALLVRALI
ncbi:MAG: hypothetical protein D6785_11000, partial [Planctomycetota bacterium]